MSEIDRWIEIAKECNYLPENDLKVTYIIRVRHMNAASLMCSVSDLPSF